MNNIKKVIEQARHLLKDKTSSPRLDAELLLAHVLQKSRTFLYTHDDKVLDDTAIALFFDLIHRREHGEPIAYLLGSKEFWGLDLKVTPDTLIPRPETELLVELSLQAFTKDQAIKVLDLGTGSGAIALAIAKERPLWQITAVDKNIDTLVIAKENAHHLELSNIQFQQSDWFDALTNLHFDLILSNPPYIAENDPHLSEGDLPFEPRGALASGPEGLDDLFIIITKSYDFLEANGVLLLEHGFSQKYAIFDKLKAIGFQQVQGWQDLQGHDRVSGGKKLPRNGI